MLYVDTSVLVALHVPEPHSARALLWFTTRPGIACACSAWTRLEFASAISRKIRSGRLAEELRPAVDASLVETLAEAFVILPVEAQHYAIATEMLSHHQTGLRSGDALHLAIAQHAGAALATLDTTLRDGAIYFGIPVSVVA